MEAGVEGVPFHRLQLIAEALRRVPEHIRQQLPVEIRPELHVHERRFAQRTARETRGAEHSEDSGALLRVRPVRMRAQRGPKAGQGARELIAHFPVVLGTLGEIVGDRRRDFDHEVERPSAIECAEGMKGDGLCSSGHPDLPVVSDGGDPTWRNLPVPR